MPKPPKRRSPEIGNGTCLLARRTQQGSWTSSELSRELCQPPDILSRMISVSSAARCFPSTFFFEGRYDPYCRPSLVVDYTKTISAPQKEVVWFDDSGHFPFFEEQRKFRDELVQRVLPLAN